MFVARDGGRAVGMGALAGHGGGVGEVKRMYTRPDVRGQRHRRRILAARSRRWRGARALRGWCSKPARRRASSAAWRVYERGGFTRCGAVLDYPGFRLTRVFYEKRNDCAA